MAPERRSWDTETMEAETLMAQCNPQWRTLGKQIGNHWVQPNPSHHAWLRLKSSKVRIQSRWDQKLAQFSENLNGCHSEFFSMGSSSLRGSVTEMTTFCCCMLWFWNCCHSDIQSCNKLHWLWTFFLWPSGKQEKINLNLIETRWYIQKSSEIDQISLAIKHATSKGVNAIQKCDLAHPLKPSWCTCGTWSCTSNSPTVLNIEIDVGSGYVEV